MQDVFLYIGISGFLAVFQVAGCGLGLAAWWHWRNEFRDKKATVKDVAGLVAGLIFISFFALAPLYIAYDFGGWIAAIFQTVVLTVIFNLVRLSHLTGDRPAPYVEDPDAERKPIVPDVRQHMLRALPGVLLCYYLAVVYVMMISGIAFPGTDADWLADLMRIEMLVIHSLPFISLITLIRFEHRHWRYFQWFLFVTWYSLYLGLVLEMRDSIDAILAFAAATLGTYLGYMLQQSDENRVVLVFKRWGICLALYALISVIVGAEDWRDDGAMLRLGFVYFLLIGTIELTPIYRIHWRRWLQDKLSRKPANNN